MVLILFLNMFTQTVIDIICENQHGVLRDINTFVVVNRNTMDINSIIYLLYCQLKIK